MRNTFIDTVIQACRERDDIFILSGDAGLGVFDAFREEFPDRFRNLGVAEQNTIGIAAGLALTGYKVFVYNIVPFVLYRCYEQVRNDICYQELPVVLVGIGSGITYAPMGMSHYSVEDIGLVQTLPNLVAISPMDPVEARAAASYSLSSTKPVYVRIPKHGEQSFSPDGQFDITEPRIIREGACTAIVFHGSISNAAMEAYQALKHTGCVPMMISVPTVQPLKTDTLLGMLSDIRHVVCVEEHYDNCGLGNMLARLKALQQPRWGLTILGIPPHVIHEIRNTNGLRVSFGISSLDIIKAVESASVSKL